MESCCVLLAASVVQDDTASWFIDDLYVTIKGLAVCNLRGAPHSYESSSVREGDIDPWGVFLGRDWSILLLAAVWRVVRVQRRPRGNWSNTGVLCRLLNPPSVTKFLSEWALMCSIWSSHMKSNTRLLLINITYTNQLFPSSEVQWGCFRRSRGKPQTDQRSRIKAADTCFLFTPAAGRVHTSPWIQTAFMCDVFPSATSVSSCWRSESSPAARADLWPLINMCRREMCFLIRHKHILTSAFLLQTPHSSLSVWVPRNHTWPLTQTKQSLQI